MSKVAALGAILLRTPQTSGANAIIGLHMKSLHVNGLLLILAVPGTAAAKRRRMVLRKFVHGQISESSKDRGVNAGCSLPGFLRANDTETYV